MGAHSWGCRRPTKAIGRGTPEVRNRRRCFCYLRYRRDCIPLVWLDVTLWMKSNLVTNPFFAWIPCCEPEDRVRSLDASLTDQDRASIENLTFTSHWFLFDWQLCIVANLLLSKSQEIRIQLICNMYRVGYELAQLWIWILSRWPASKVKP